MILRMKFFSGLLMLVAAVFASAGASVSHAQPAVWPTKPVRMLVGFPPGGPTDVVARIVAEKVANHPHHHHNTFYFF